MIRRKNYFIKKNFQVNFISKFLILILLEAVLIVGLFMRVSNNTLTTGYFDSVLTIERTPDFFFVPIILIMLIVAIGIGIAGMIVFIMLSHRIAGPLYRFEKDIMEVGSGDLTKRINLRKTDQLAELKESLNIFIDSLDQKMSRIKNNLAELKELVSKKDDPGNIEKIYEMMELLNEDVEGFKVTSEPNE